MVDRERRPMVTTTMIGTTTIAGAGAATMIGTTMMAGIAANQGVTDPTKSSKNSEQGRGINQTWWNRPTFASLLRLAPVA